MKTFPNTTSGPTGAKAILGLVVLQSDETIEQDFARIFADPEVAVYATRVTSAPEVTTETLAQMGPSLKSSAALLPPSLAFGCVGYGCTSGTSVIGPDAVHASLKEGSNAAEATDPLSALISACKVLKIKRLAFLSPYIELVSEGLRSCLHDAGISCPALGSFNVSSEAVVARIDEKSILSAATELCAGQDVDGLFLSCTNLRTLNVIDPLEHKLGIPVLSSNQVLAWHMARLTSAPAMLPGALAATV